MDDGDPRRRPPDESAADLQALARDWITLWQSELAAAAVDRELQEGWQTLAALWAGAATALVQSWPRGGADASAGGVGAGAAAAPRAAPAAAAPDPRDAEIERLRRRIDALERRLAALDGGEAGP
ncbi:MAG: hypothetical protein M0Z28_12035 [Rhodospirillales bacterium]|nr:hypothetical protein [Rhodospirillales bacterium]